MWNANQLIVNRGHNVPEYEVSFGLCGRTLANFSPMKVIASQ